MSVADLRSQLQRDEGLRLKPYLDCCGRFWRLCECPTKGKLTIGYGRNLDDKGVSEAEASGMLDNDIRDFTAAVVAELPWIIRLDEARRAVLVNMALNIGIGGLMQKNPKALAACQRGDYAEAAREMLDGPWKHQVGPRAFRLARQMETGEWQ